MKKIRQDDRIADVKIQSPPKSTLASSVEDGYICRHNRPEMCQKEAHGLRRMEMIRKMFNVYRKEINWGGRPLILETGKIARQADASILATYGETTVLCTVVAEKQPKPGVDFFPLTVNYQEKAFATGRIPGGFFKREGRPSEKEVLTSRLIDRPIRPLFLPGFYHDTQVICTTLSHDLENDPDIVALIGVSAALTLSGLPFMGPIGAARVGYRNGEFLLNPTGQELKDSALDLVVAGTTEGVLMVESEAQELPEDIMLQAVMFGQNSYQEVIKAIIQLAETCAKEPWDFDPARSQLPAEITSAISAAAGQLLQEAYAETVKQARRDKIDQAKAAALAALPEEFVAANANAIKSYLKSLEADIVRGAILDTGIRIDGRRGENIRTIVPEVGVLPRTHGSALFTRGETQALCVATLGTGEDEQIIDALEGEYRERFLLHYNFPPFSVGETGRVGAPGRREIGHGKLAWRALRPVLPTAQEFPYTLRVVSEITESNGSSSMATVCGGALSLMDAGVPLKRPVAGIAMGLIKEGDRFAVLSDILGDEDHLGDMDFKVAGTAQGITALQMDIKITSITEEIMRIALGQAQQGRMHILGEMNKALTGARTEVSEHAPRMFTMKIEKDKIREVIGSGGKVIREIVETTGAKIDIEEDGTIKISAIREQSAQAAIARIKGIVAEPEIGEVYQGKVVKIAEFGAFVNFLGAKDGLVHISEIAHQRIRKVSDVLEVGQTVKVKVLGVDDRGKIKLSIKALLEQDNQPPADPIAAGE